MKIVVVILAALALSACEEGVYPTFVCQHRNIESGVCTKGEYICYAPTEIYATSSGRPKCKMSAPARTSALPPHEPSGAA